jgi:xanthine dehydrogenase YagT iron-sulfur-binding subunit
MAPRRDCTNDDGQFGFSRRDFLKTAGIGGLAATIGGVEESEAQTAALPILGPDEVPVTLNVNGKQVNLRIEPRVTLLDALRMRVDLTGNKRVCDRGTCGACTMIVDGRSRYACSTLAIDVQGSEIRTIDGLARGDTLHPVQQAFCDTDALMCGFCTPGFVMATVAALEKHSNPTPEQMRKALDGNICRCGTFVRVLEAAMNAAKGVKRG